MNIRPYRPSDLAEWLRMRTDLWPDSDAADAHAWLRHGDSLTVVASLKTDRRLIGFAEAGERLYADGCESSPVAFLEGWYVDPQYCNQHVGLRLLTAVENWARQRGLTELASDTILENEPANRAHRALGFAEVERSIKYRKPL